MRVAIVGPTYPFRGGIAHHTTLLAAALRAQHDVLFVSFRGQYPLWLFPGRSDRDPSARAPSGQVDYLLKPLLPWTWLRTGRRVTGFRPHITLIPWWVPFWAPSAGAVARVVRRAGTGRVVFICHNVVPHEGAGRVARALTTFALGGGQAFIVHSAADEARLRALLPRVTSRPGAVHRALLPVHAIAAPVDRADARRALGLAPGDRVALFFGFVRPYKGLEQLIHAVALAARQAPDLRLVVAGEFWLSAEEFTRQAERLGIADRVQLHDAYVPNEAIGSYFGAADVVVLPYLQATQSGVVTLAAQFGLPVVATRVGGLPEAVIDGGTGLIVPPGDPVALSRALVRVLSDDELAARLRAGVAAGRSRFDWAALVGLVEELARPS